MSTFSDSNFCKAELLSFDWGKDILKDHWTHRRQLEKDPNFELKLDLPDLLIEQSYRDVTQTMLVVEFEQKAMLVLKNLENDKNPAKRARFCNKF